MQYKLHIKDGICKTQVLELSKTLSLAIEEFKLLTEPEIN